MNKSHRERIIKALGEFSPNALSRHLKRSQEGIVYFDRDQVVNDPENEAMFYYMLNRDYIAGYKNIDNLTVYFEVVGDEIVAGGYDLSTGKTTSRRRLISTNEDLANRTPYTYTKEALERFKNTITNT